MLLSPSTEELVAYRNDLIGDSLNGLLPYPEQRRGTAPKKRHIPRRVNNSYAATSWMKSFLASI
jgi:hypothetical protein